MTKNPFLKIALSSLLGLIICGIALSSGVWEIGPRLTAIDLWFSLRASLLHSQASLPSTMRQQAIFYWLSTVIAGFGLQVFMTIVAFNWRKVVGWSISAVIWAITLLSTLVLLIHYHAVVSGVMGMAFGSTVALASEVWFVVGELIRLRSNPAQELLQVEQRWLNVLNEAKEQKLSFSILAVHATPLASYEELQILQTELRGRDLIYPVQEGMFVLLWEITPEHTPRIASKLINVLQGYSTRTVQIGFASFPSDGENLKTLLVHATQALTSAKQIGGSLIVPFSSPASKEARAVLASWEGLLAESSNAQTPVVLMFFKTSQPLNLTVQSLIRKELRGRDLVTAFENGFYVFLWNATGEGSKIVCAKLQQVLASAKIANTPVLAFYPQDGKTLDELLAVLERQISSSQ